VENTWKLDADGLQQQNSTGCSQKTEATICTGSPKLDNGRLEKNSEYDVNNTKAYGSILPCINGSGWWCNGGIFLAHFGPLSTNLTWFNDLI